MERLNQQEAEALRAVVKKGGQMRLGDFMGVITQGSIQETIAQMVEKGLLHNFEGWSGFAKNVGLYAITDKGRELLENWEAE